MEQSQCAIHVLTEGKSDWIHLKNANQALGICPSIDFDEREDDGGDQALLKTCVNVAKVAKSRPTIFGVDRDNLAIVKEVTVPGRPYKAWGHNVFSLAIAIHRSESRTRWYPLSCCIGTVTFASVTSKEGDSSSAPSSMIVQETLKSMRRSMLVILLDSGTAELLTRT